MKNRNLFARYSTKTPRNKQQRRCRKPHRDGGLNFEQLENRLLLAAVTVGTAADVIDGDTSSITNLISNPGTDGAISLREALAAADTTPEIDTITFDATVFNGEAVDVIRLSSTTLIREPVTIDAGDLDVVVTGDTGRDDSLIAGTFISDTADIFNERDNVTTIQIIGDTEDVVTIRGLTITGGGSRDTQGGGISSQGVSLLIENSVLAGNFAESSGAILIEDGSLVVNNSTISQNQLGNFFFNSSSGAITAINSDVTINNSILNDNEGRAVSSVGQGNIIINGSTLSGNASQFGGAISISTGTLTVSNTTISGNSAEFDGGGILSGSGDVIISDSTITANDASDGGGISFGDPFGFNNDHSLLTIENSIVAGNSASRGADIFLQLFYPAPNIEVRSSLIGSNDGTLLAATPDQSSDADGNIIGDALAPIDPLLAELADNGGPTQTHALLPGSPAIDAGSTDATTDQRGETRPNIGGSGPDIGAFEEQSLTLVVDTSNDLIDGDFSAGNQSLREAIQRTNANPGLDTIVFDAAVFDGEADDVIRLLQGELVITDEVIIFAGDQQVVVSADALGNDIVNPDTFVVDIAASQTTDTLSDNSRVFNIATTADVPVSLIGLTITGGSAAGGGGILVSSTVVDLTDVNVTGNQSAGGNGGGIQTDSQLTLNNSVVSSNIASNRGSGGGIAASSESVTLNNSVVSDNLATSFRGGGITTTTGDVFLNNSTITRNTIQGGSRGGGIGTTSGNVTVIESSVTNNSSDFQGGGIFSDTGTITISDSTLGENSSAGDGGGVFSEAGNVTINNATLSGNTSVRDGGGVYSNTGTIVISNSTLSGNSSGDDGGGIFSNQATVTVSNSTLVENTSDDDGGGIFAFSGEVSIVSSTISGNSVGDNGGGIAVVAADLSIVSSTVAFNGSERVNGGGGVFNGNDAVTSTFEIQNSIIASNTGSGTASDLRFDVNSDPLDASFSLIGANTGTPLVATTIGSPDANGNLIGSSQAIIDPLLLRLDTNGGPTQTHALSENSPAINAGSSSLSTDQRGTVFLRDEGNGVDIGSYEFQNLQLLVDTAVDAVDRNLSTGELSLREAVLLANVNPGEDLIRFDPNEFRRNFLGSFIAPIHLQLGELTVTESLHIDGQDLGVVISGDANRNDFNISGTDITDLSEIFESQLEDNSAVLNITAAAGELITLSGLTITGGNGSDFAAINNGAADLVINDSLIAGNRNSESGAGLSNDSGSVTINRTTISDNQTLAAGASGGGIFSDQGDVSISLSTINGNQTLGANAFGGGIHTVDGSISLTLSTVSGNQTLGEDSNGGGIFSANGELTFESVTVTNNTATGLGGGVFVPDSSSNPSFTLHNTIVAGNNASEGTPDLGFDADGSVDVQFSLIGDGTGSSLAAAPVGSPDANGNLVGAAGTAIDPLLGVLADNRGATFTHQLLAGSPAIDVGSSALTTDQRDDSFFARDDGAGVDIGAFERFFFNLVVDTTRDIDDGDLSPGNLSLREALAISDRNPVDDSITFDSSVFNGQQDDVIRLDLESLTISDGVIIDAGALGVVVSGDVAGDDILVAGTNLTDTFSSDDNDTLDDNVGVFEITAAAGEQVVIIGLTITGGVGSADGGGIFNDDADIVFTNSLIAGNRSGRFDDGGGIFSSDGSVTLNQTVVTSNDSDGRGGGVFSTFGEIILNQSSVNGNVSSRAGGGISSSLGSVVLNQSSVENNITINTGGDGGGIYAGRGDVTLTNSVVNNNSTDRLSDGGGISTDSGDITLTASTVSNNSTGERSDGGGIFTNDGNITLTASTISNNSVGDDSDGGGIDNDFGTVTAIRSTISQNQAGEDGGGVASFAGDLIFINSTISGNQSGENGGGIDLVVSGLLYLFNSTVTNNQSGGDGGGLLRGSSIPSTTLLIENSIVADNVTTGGIGPDLLFDSNINSEVRFSLIGNNEGTPLLTTDPNAVDADGNRIGSTGDLVDPLLDVLADNGGPTLTHALLSDSPAFNAGGPTSVDVGDVDQRGVTRVAEGQIDIGSFEAILTVPVTNVILSSSGFNSNFIDAIDGDGLGGGNGLGYSLVSDQPLTTVPWQGIDTLFLQFSDDVSETLIDGSVLLTGTNGGDYAVNLTSYSLETNIATFSIPSGIGNDSLVISIFDGSVTNNDNLPVAGSQGNPFNFRFNVLLGDVNGSGQVNSVDAFEIVGFNTDQTTPENFRYDIDGSGQINSIDAFAAHANITNGLPTPSDAPLPPEPLSIASAFSTPAAIDAGTLNQVPTASALEAPSSIPEASLLADASSPAPDELKGSQTDAPTSDQRNSHTDEPDAEESLPAVTDNTNDLPAQQDTAPPTEPSALSVSTAAIDDAFGAPLINPGPLPIVPTVSTVSPQPSFSITNNQTAAQRSNQLALLDAASDLTLAGHVEPDEVELDESDDFFTDTETPDEISACELDSFFEDNWVSQ